MWRLYSIDRAGIIICESERLFFGLIVFLDHENISEETLLILLSRILLKL